MATKRAAKKGAAGPKFEPDILKSSSGAKRKPARPKLQNVTEKSAWTEQKERAALLLAQDKLSDELIAKDLEISRMTLARWKVEPEFIARRAAILEEIKAAVVAMGIAARQNRVDALNDRHRRMREVIEARAEEHKGYKGGGRTGLLVRQLKVIGKGEEAQTVEEYSVDTPLLREMREHEKQTAIEMGEWTEKREHTGKDGEDLFKHITVEIVDPHESPDE